MRKRKIAVLGATGSIGASALEVLRRNSGIFEPVLFSSHRNEAGLRALKHEFPRAKTVLTGAERPAGDIDYAGRPGLMQGISRCGAFMAVNGIAGAAGLEPSLAVLDAGIHLALANKETMVMAAPLVLSLARARKRWVIPVDSEHAALFSLIEAHRKEEVAELILTASGGPFRNRTKEQLETVTPEEALRHPTWNMGKKITVDSATLANKGLEVIEAAGLFTVDPSRIKVVIHPQSIVHSLIRCKSGSLYAQLSQPDMRLPIQNALFYPRKGETFLEPLRLEDLNLEFGPADAGRFPMLGLAYRAAASGMAAQIGYNAANEAAVQAFLERRIRFADIPRVVAAACAEAVCPLPGSWGLQAVLDADMKARELAEQKIALYRPQA
ncbi:MAG: 1-deoxy-D-xylulose-5-phosphate reductoisomerase [Spirochaetaceae bacterium]|jgi:1-deoxy-D-xylulose-5-phosphate reductoisomerase|nr:1-deoxy-D-xylulose-5-phosphate reductoisomerase [Spirochaetaceae bacterium]